MPSARRCPCGRLLASLVADRPEAEKLEDLVARAAELLLVAPRRRGPEIEAEQARARAQVMGDDDAVARRHALEDRRFLEGAHDPLARHDMRREPGDHLAVEAHLAAGRLHEGRDQLEDGRLARAVGADDRQDFVRLDVERDLVDGGQAAVALGEVPDREDRRHRQLAAPRRQPEAEEAVRQQEDQEDHHARVDQELIFAGLEQEVPAEIEHERAEHRAEHVAEPAEEAVQHEVDAVVDGEARRIDRLGDGDEDRPADAAEKRRDRVGEHPEERHVEAHRGGEVLVLAQRREQLPDPRIDQPPQPGEAERPSS